MTSSSQKPLQTQLTHEANIQTLRGIRTRDPSNQAAVDLQLRQRDHRDRQGKLLYRNLSKQTEENQEKWQSWRPRSWGLHSSVRRRGATLYSVLDVWEEHTSFYLPGSSSTRRTESNKRNYQNNVTVRELESCRSRVRVKRILARTARQFPIHKEIFIWNLTWMNNRLIASMNVMFVYGIYWTCTEKNANKQADPLCNKWGVFERPNCVGATAVIIDPNPARCVSLITSAWHQHKRHENQSKYLSRVNP